MKKVLAIALACAVSSFAAWDRFPVIEDGKGEMKIAFDQGRQAYHPHSDMSFKIRYSPMEHLELTSQPFGDAFSNYVLGARYQILPKMLSAGVDIGFPVNVSAWSFTPGVQFFMELSSALVFAANVDLAIYTETAEGQGEYSRGMDISGGLEVDFTMGQSTIWAGFDFGTGLTKSSMAGKELDIAMKDDDASGNLPSRELTLTPAVGYIASIKETLDLGTWVGFTIGSVNNKDAALTTTVGVDASVKF